MQLRSSRTLVLPMSPEQAWKALSDPIRLAALVPELESASWGPGGRLSLAARVGWRRRPFVAKTTQLEAPRLIALASDTPTVGFTLEARIDPHPEGCVLRLDSRLEPPAHWLRKPKGVLGSRELFRRLMVSSVLFALAVAGLVAMPERSIPPWLAALGWSVLGVVMLVAVAMLSGTQRRLPGGMRWRRVDGPFQPRASRLHA